ncbi:uncharacterized protein LOC114319069 isoform X4 [Camellia sinensis]|uniref:uncharacterized protein LOC114319069 isoform X4 n=1 Tax=Camellia sinensis TaxID=4442 RepID=UPI001036F0BE|nr:uncharacterized protein LOC114319069 isoform X4 [Camellia sinensis]
MRALWSTRSLYLMVRIFPALDSRYFSRFYIMVIDEYHGTNPFIRESEMSSSSSSRRRRRRRRKERVRWIQHYNNGQKILLVGEGDFSFSACLARAFGSAVNMVATSLHSQELLKVKHWTSEAELQTLERLGCLILHEVGVYEMGNHPTLSRMKFDVVIFNFPHAGHFHGFCERDEELIGMHRELLTAFFENARDLLEEGGEVHVTHRDDYPYNTWGLEKLASKAGFYLKEKVEFEKGNYPGYHNKRGGDINCNKPFPLKLCFTFKFTLKKSYLPKNNVIDHNNQMVKKIDTVSGDRVKCIVKSFMPMNDVIDDHNKMVRKIGTVSGDMVECIVKSSLPVNDVVEDHNKMVRKIDIVSGDRVKCVVESSMPMNDVVDDHDKMMRKIDTVSDDRMKCIIKNSMPMNDVVDDDDKMVEKIDTVSGDRVKFIVKSSMPMNEVVDNHDKMVRKIDTVSRDRMKCIVKKSMPMNDVIDNSNKIDTLAVLGGSLLGTFLSEKDRFDLIADSNAIRNDLIPHMVYGMFLQEEPEGSRVCMSQLFFYCFILELIFFRRESQFVF